jgi:hypothetical protein
MKDNVSLIERKELMRTRENSKGDILNRSIIGNSDVYKKKWNEKNLKYEI